MSVQRNATGFFAALLCVSAARTQGLDAKPWNRFHDFAELCELSEQIAKRWPTFVTREAIGKSVQGRTIWALTVTNPKTGTADSKPAMYLDANIHGNEVQGGEASLYMVWYLLRKAPSVPRLRALRDRVTLYVLPCVNPDGRAFWFAHANTAHSSRGGQMPTDNDGDGLYDEDPPNDLDGDGHLTQMRKYTPGQGQYRIDPDDPRLMLRVKPGKRGDWTLLGIEGIDDDGDGRVNEDGPGGYDPNRDFGSDWQPSWIQYGARPYPFQLPESRAVRDFLLAHTNVAGVQAFHNAGGMVLRGPGSKWISYAAGDVPAYDAIGKVGEEMLPFYRYMVIWRDLYTVHGGFIDWTYLGLGILSFTNELWTQKRLDPARTTPPNAAQRQAWTDRLTFGSHTIPWKDFDHPVYGKIQIGGHTKDTGRVPPGFLVQEMLHRNAAFVLYQASELPEIVTEKVRVSRAGGALRYVTIRLRNTHLTPTRTAQAAQHHIGRPDILHATSDDVQILRAGRTTNRYRPSRAKLLDHRVDPHRIPLESGIASRGVLEMTYLVQLNHPSKGGQIHFRFEAQKAKDLTWTTNLAPR